MSIKYRECGIELHEAIERAGHILYWRDGQWIADDEQAVQAIIDSFDPLETRKKKMWEAVKQERERRINAGFVYGGVRYDSDPASVMKIIGASVMALISLSRGSPLSLKWTAADNRDVMLSATDIISVGMALGAYVDACHQAARDARERINAAKSIDELDAITVTWP